MTLSIKISIRLVPSLANYSKIILDLRREITPNIICLLNKIVSRVWDLRESANPKNSGGFYEKVSGLIVSDVFNLPE